MKKLCNWKGFRVRRLSKVARVRKVALLLLRGGKGIEPGSEWLVSHIVEVGLVKG